MSSSSSSLSVHVPEVFQYFLHLAAQLDLLTMSQSSLEFHRWLADAKKQCYPSHRGTVPFKLLTSEAEGRKRVVAATSVASASSGATTPPPGPETTSEISPQEVVKRAIVCTFVKKLVGLLVERGYPISSESVIPSNSAAIIAEQAAVIRELQLSHAEVEKEFQAQLELLSAAAAAATAAPSTSVVVATSSSPPPPPPASAEVQRQPSAPQFLPHQHLAAASAASAGTPTPPPVDLRLLEAKQEIARLKGSVMVYQKDLAASQRHAADLVQKCKESDDTIESLEIAFAALESVHKNEQLDQTRLESIRQQTAESTIARLTKVLVLQGEQLLVAEETRARTQRQHMEELDRISMAHSVLVGKLKDEVQDLVKTVEQQGKRNAELTALQAELSGRQAKALDVVTRNSVAAVERQYQPRVHHIHISTEDLKRKAFQRQQQVSGGNLQGRSATADALYHNFRPASASGRTALARAIAEFPLSARSGSQACTQPRPPSASRLPK